MFWVGKGAGPKQPFLVSDKSKAVHCLQRIVGIKQQTLALTRPVSEDLVANAGMADILSITAYSPKLRRCRGQTPFESSTGEALSSPIFILPVNEQNISKDMEPTLACVQS